MTKKVKRWSRDDVSFLLYNLNNGMPLAEIAGYLLRTVSSVQAKLVLLRDSKRANSRLRRWTTQETAKALELLESGSTLDQVAAQLGRTKPALKMRLWKCGHIRPDADRPWTEAEVARAKTMRAEGATVAEIAEAVGRTREAVWGKFAYMAKLERTERVNGVEDFGETSMLTGNNLPAISVPYTPR